VVKPSDVLWPRSRHTAAKHQLLVGYLNAWIGILGSWAEHVLLVDGFAGPGVYEGGEPGSPMLMLDAFLRRKDRATLKPLFHYVFIEQNMERHRHLQELVTKRTLVAGRTVVEVVHGDFAAVFPSRLDEIRGRFGEVPTFAFIDPFGAGDDVAHLASNLVSLPRCEALVYVPITHLARFVEHPDLETTFDRLYDGPAGGGRVRSQICRRASRSCRMRSSPGCARAAGTCGRLRSCPMLGRTAMCCSSAPTTTSGCGG
jgi:three-Cys-motif partner protein